ncbi:MAG: NAD-dependent epimerase/dehydratase family protein [Balneolaceae bacterium]
MKAFVTGGTGFIGSHLVDALLEQYPDSPPRCLIRSDMRWLKGKPIEPVHGDLFDENAILEGLKGCDTLFHLAAILKAPTQEALDRVNVEATERLFQLALKAGVQRVLILSSLAASGPSKGRPRIETDTPVPTSMYGISKWAMEKRIHECAPTGLPVTLIRPPVVYGPREDQVYTWFQMVNRGICPIVGRGESPKLSMVHVSDLVEGTLTAAKTDRDGVSTYFLTGPEIANWNRLRDLTLTLLDKKAVTLYVPPSWVRRLAAVTETTAGWFGHYPVFNREKADEMILEWTCSSDLATQELGYSPRYTLDNGFKETLQWYQEKEWL